MDGAAWVRSQLAGSSCASCGDDYRPDGIRVLAQRESLFFVALDCPACASEAVAMVSLEHPAGRPVALHDVRAMRTFLRDFDGDFRSLFGIASDDPNRSAGA